MPAHIRILATIETDPTRYHGEHAHRPLTPGPASCEQLLAHLAADLERLFPEAAQCSLALPGALYDQTQILRPGFPLFERLERSVESAIPGSAGRILRLALSLASEDNAAAPFQPDPAIPPGLLQNLPLVVSGDAEVITGLAEAMEHRFLEQGQLSAHSAKGLESIFGIAVTHARFMTVTDLMAMLRLQLEHFGFLPLWELLYAALENDPNPASAAGQLGQQFEYRQGAVHGQFETFDYWSRLGGGKDLSADGRALEQAYADWTREYRQFITTLAAHAVPVQQHLPESVSAQLETAFVVEHSDHAPPADAAEVTEHSFDDLGILAVTVVRESRQFNYYPLSPEGLNMLHGRIRSLGLGPGGFAYPGRILHDRQQRCLVPDTAPPDDA